MTYLYAGLLGHIEWVLYAVSLLVGAMPDVLALLRKRGFGRRRGFGRSRRRRRGGGIFGALGVLLLVFLLGIVAILAVIAYVVYRLIRARR